MAAPIPPMLKYSIVYNLLIFPPILSNLCQNSLFVKLFNLKHNTFVFPFNDLLLSSFPANNNNKNNTVVV